MTTENGGRDRAATLDERQTTTARAILTDDGIIRVTMFGGFVQTRDQALENMALVREMVGARRVIVLVDIREEARADKAALDIYADPKQNPTAVSVAVLLDSPMSMVMGNFFMRINRPQIPTRLFTREREAVAWLYEQLAAAEGSQRA